MLCQSSEARIEPPRQAGRRVGPFTSLTAVDLLALVDAAAIAPAQEADLDGKISTIDGFTIGGGIEYAFTDGVIFGLEYKTLTPRTSPFASDGNDDVLGPVPVKIAVAMGQLSLKFGDERVGRRS
jgi:hypothetical protein